MPAAALAVAVALGAVLSTPMPPAFVAIPDEPGTQLLLEAAVYQAVAADLDADGGRELVVLTSGDGSAIAASAWRESDAGWGRVGEPLGVVPRAAVPGVAWLGTPVRLLVRSVGGEERVTLVRQPIYRDPDDGPACCLLVHDLILEAGGLRLVQAAPTRTVAEAVWVVDLDGDGTDELVATQSVPPLGDTSYPTDAHLFRWAGRAFRITTTRLEIGSGDTPFLLGDSDGRPGEELAINATLGRRALYRLSLGEGDRLETEDAGLVVDDALAVPVEGGVGLAAVTSGGSLTVRTWPAGSAPSDPIGEVQLLATAELLAAVDVAGVPSLLVRQVIGGDRLHAFALPGLAPPRFGAVTRTPIAAALSAGGPVAPYVGPIPGGGPDGRSAVVFAGRLLGTDAPAGTTPSTGRPVATLGAAQPIGLVGAGLTHLAVLHGVEAVVAIDPSGGRLEAPHLVADAAVSVAPLAVAWRPEAGDATLDPPTTGARALGSGRSIGVGEDGFTARVEAPPGSRVYGADGPPASVPADGTLDVHLRPPAGGPGLDYRALLAVTTPAGHSYLASWEVRVLDQPPPLEAAAVTTFGSGEVEIAGRSAPYVTVTIDGAAVALDAAGRFRATRPAPPWPTEFVMEATDPFGNVATRRLSVIGWVDYRGLPWIPISVLAVVGAGALLYLRVPRALVPSAQPDDGAAVEELDLE